MASAKSLEDMLSSEVDESAVSALVGSLESQLASPTTVGSAAEGHGGPITNNHVNSTTPTEGPLSRMHDGQKHGLPTLAQGGSSGSLLNSDVVVSTPKALAPGNQQVMGVNSVASTAVTPTNTITVTLAGAVPACGYINQVTSATTQQALISSAASIAAAARGPGAPEIKIVYPPQTTTIGPFSTLGINSSGMIQAQRPAGVPNGNAATTAAASATSKGPVHPNNTVSISAMQNLASVAAQQQPLLVPGTNSTMQQVQGKMVQAAGRLTVREQLEQKQQEQKMVPKPHIVIKQDGTSTSVAEATNAAVVQQQVQQMSMMKGGPGTVIAVTKQGPLQASGAPAQPVNVMTQVVSNPNIIQGVQIVNVNTVRPGTPGGQGQKALAPRVVIGNPVRIAAASTQVLGARPGTPGPPGSVPNTITLQPGNLVRGTLLVKTENGQYQLVNVGTTLPGSNSSNLPGTYRFQSVAHAGAQSPVRNIAPQQVTVTLPVSQANQQVKVHPPTVGTPPHTVVQSMLQGTQPAVSIVTTAPRMGTPVATVPPLVHQVTSSSVSVPTTPLNIQTTLHPSLTSATSIATASTQQNSAASQMSPDTAKKKCKNFLSTLLRLASDQPPNVATNVRNLIQGLIDANVQPEDFTNQLQRELNSSPQPCLVPFLKKSLPYLRRSLATGELTIDGVEPPPPNVVVTLPAIPSSIPQIHISPTRPSIPAPPTQVRLMTPGPPGTIQLSQPALQGLLPQQRLFSPAQRIQHTTSMAQGKSLLAGSTIRPMVGGAAVMSPATVGALQRVQTLRTPAPQTAAALKEKEKRSYSSTLRDDDDINDVAAMGGVNLVEESQRILAANAEFVGTQIRSCKDENFLFTGPLQQRIKSIVARMGLEEPSPEVAALISHATQERLKMVVEKLGVIAEHRLDIVKTDPRYEVTQDVKGQLKFLEELDRLEKKRHEEQEREILMRAAKSRSKVEDPEQLKLKQKAKEMQRAELEEMRQREANMTALLAIGPRKKLKLDSPGNGSTSQSNTTGSFSSTGNFTSSPSRPQMRQRVKRVNLRDLIFLLEQERDTCRSVMLYKSYLK